MISYKMYKFVFESTELNFKTDHKRTKKSDNYDKKISRPSMYVELNPEN